jgi:hypothetical protein
MARTKYLFSPAKAGSPGLFLSICVIVERRISIKLGYDFKNILSKMQNYALRETDALCGGVFQKPPRGVSHGMVLPF